MRIHTTATYNEVMSAISATNRALDDLNLSARHDDPVYEYRSRSNKGRSRIALVSARISEHSSRTHARAFEVQLFGDSSRGPNSGFYGMDNYGDKAATWDQWGMFLSALYEVDPLARVGGAKNPVYIDAEHFHWSTANRYAGTEDDKGVSRIDAPTGTFLTAGKGYHRQHRWTYNSGSVTGTFIAHECACGAYMRRTSPDTWRDVISDGAA